MACFHLVLYKIIHDEELKGINAYFDDITVYGNSVSDHGQNMSKYLSHEQKCGLDINKQESAFLEKTV